MMMMMNDEEGEKGKKKKEMEKGLLRVAVVSRVPQTCLVREQEAYRWAETARDGKEENVFHMLLPAELEKP